MFLPAIGTALLSLPTVEPQMTFPLPIIKFKKKCCKDFKTGKRCKRCPGRMKEYMRQRAAVANQLTMSN